jgi:hypothetical protein
VHDGLRGLLYRVHDNDRGRYDGKDGTLYDDVQGLRRHVQDGIHDDVQGKRVCKADVQHVRRHVRGVRNGVRKDGRQDGHVQAVRRGVQKMRTGMQKHDEVTPLFLVYQNSDKNKFVTKKIKHFLPILF